jgi:hypothetical protein
MIILEARNSTQWGDNGYVSTSSPQIASFERTVKNLSFEKAKHMYV